MDSGQDQLNADNSVSTFVSALWFNAALGIAFFGAFVVLRTHRPQTYAPREFATPLGKRPPPLSRGPVKWIWELFRISQEDQIKSMGLDRYMILRFLRMGLVVFVSFALVGIPVMFPLNIIGQLDSPGLNKLTIGNVQDAKRLWAHLVLSVLFTIGLIYYTFRETRHYLVLRREYLMSEEYKNSVMARTIFIPSIPKDANSVESLKRIFDKFSGGVKYVWLNRDLQDLPDKVDERQQNVNGLEQTITKLILASYKKNIELDQDQNPHRLEGGHQLAIIPQALRPTHRVKPKFMPFGLPCVGRKVDSIDYYNEEIARLNEDINKKQQHLDSYPQLNSAFVEFHYQSAAQMAAQTLVHHIEMQMAPRYINVNPSDIIWENMNIGPYDRLVRRFISILITTVIVIFWAIPVVFVQSISSLNSLAKILPFLSGVQKWPPAIVGIIQGILPAVLLAILIALVPIVFALLSKFEGIPQKSFVDLSVLHKYFFFQFVDVVLVSTIAGGILQTLPQLLKDPTSVIGVLAENLPKASTFFITFVMLQATNGAGSAILQLVPFILSYVMPFFSTTPRDIYSRKTTMAGVTLGTLIPSHTIIFVLGIEYSTIAPLILPFVILFFALNYFVYLYQFMYVYELEYETGGRAFPRAIRHIYIGMFTWQLTMVGLYAVRGSQALGQLIITIILIVLTAFALGLYDKAFKPMFKFLPMDSFDPVEMDIGINKDTEPSLTSSKANLIQAQHIENDQVASDQGQKTLMDQDNKANEGLRLRKATSNPVDESYNDDQLEVDAVRFCQKLRQELIAETDHMQQDDAIENTDTLMRTQQLMDAQAYMHPAAYSMQPAVWLPQDELGITGTEVKQLQEQSVLATSQYATAYRNKKNKGEVQIDEQALIVEHRGIPGSLPVPGSNLTSVQNYVRTVVDNLNFFSAMGGTNVLATGLGV